MATNFPSGLDALTNPISTNTLASPSHSAQHADANDAIEALQTKVGVNSSAVTTSHDYKIAQLEAKPVLETIIISVSDETTAITTGVAKVTFRMPFAMTLTAVRASLTTVSTSGLPTFDINEGGVTILSTKITIDANELTSTTAATAPVISDTSLADNAEITVDIDVAGTGAKGAKIYLIGQRT